jgi:hypothetical protein
MATRRQFLRRGVAGGAGLYQTTKFGVGMRVPSQIRGGTLSPDVIRKFVTPLLVPPAMPLTASGPTTAYHALAVYASVRRAVRRPCGRQADRRTSRRSTSINTSGS